MGLDLHTETQLKLRQQRTTDLWEALAEEEHNTGSLAYIAKEMTRMEMEATYICTRASEELMFIAGVDITPESLVEYYKRTTSYEGLIDLWLRENIYNGDRSIPIEEEE